MLKKVASSAVAHGGAHNFYHSDANGNITSRCSNCCCDRPTGIGTGFRTSDIIIMENELDTKIRAVCEILEKVSANFSEDIEKHDAIKIAALAYVFAMTRHRSEFEHYMATLREPLTEEQEARLKELLR